MKKIIFSVFFVGLMMVAQAQEQTQQSQVSVENSPSSNQQEILKSGLFKLSDEGVEYTISIMKARHPDLFEQYKSRVKKFNNMKISGIVLTSVGIAAAVAGLSVLFVDLHSGFGLFHTGLYLGCVYSGYALIGAGIPLWVVGTKRPNKIKRKVAEEYLRSMNDIGYNYNYAPQIKLSMGTIANGAGCIINF
ncbi:MAG: hypothetical protein LBR45_00830 [Bacteroidales bacterium]|jgi:hypothetical protein|nr:hypothetical protein [Bacteroidales bacterium]